LQEYGKVENVERLGLQQTNDDLYRHLAKQWESIYGYPLSAEDTQQLSQNISSFFLLLQRWEKDENGKKED
jgi:hypothetical protein